MKIAAILAEGFEETEFIAVVDLLRRAKQDVCVVSLTEQLTVAGSHNFKIVADVMWADVDFDDIDCIFLPGGMPGVTNLQASSDVVDMVRKFVQSNKFVVAICAAPLVLNDAGVLENKKFTCYPATAASIKNGTYSEESVVIDGKSSRILVHLCLRSKADNLPRPKVSAPYGTAGPNPCVQPAG